MKHRFLRFCRPRTAALLGVAAFPACHIPRALYTLSICVTVCIPAVASAAGLYSDDFNSAASASSYSTYITAGASGPSSDATFGLDYSTLGVPAAPHTTDGTTLGLRLRVDDLQASSSSSGTAGAISVVTKGLTLPSSYKVSADVWGNYIGATNLSSSGTNGTTLVGMGLGSAGTAAQSPNTNDGFLVSTAHDGGNSASSNSDYRVYTNNTRSTPTNSTYYAAGTTSTSGDNTNAYYTSLFPSHSAPTVQQTMYPSSQGGSTPTGIVGFAWHTFDLVQDGTNVSWYIDNKLIATVPDSALTFGGSQVSLGSFDTGLTGNYSADGQALNFDLFDNLTIVSLVPEPSTWLGGALLLGGAGLILRRRLRRAVRA